MSADDIATKDDLKSGQYTFTAPMILGATLAGADDDMIDRIREIGKTIGVAFQMRDDLLDRLPDDDGKTKFSDIHEGNQTVVWSYLLHQLTGEEKEHLTSLRKKDLSGHDCAWLHDLISTHDIKRIIGQRIDTDLQKARTMIAKEQRNEDYVDHMFALLDFLAINKKQTA